MKYKTIDRYPNYKIGSDGTVWTRWGKVRDNRGRYVSVIMKKYSKMKLSLSNDRQVVNLTDSSGKVRLWFVHHLVLVTFIGPRPKGMECRHLDGNSTNNNLYNLRWGTSKENKEDMLKHGTRPVGVLQGQSKLTDEDVILMRKLFADGWRNRDLSDKFKVCCSVVSNVVHRKAWTHI